MIEQLERIDNFPWEADNGQGEGICHLIWIILAVTAILFVGSFIQGVSGFGFGLFAMGFLPLVFTLKESVLILLCLTLVISCRMAWSLREYIDWKGLLFVLSAAMAGRAAAFFILHRYGALDTMKVWLGVFLIGMVVYLMARKRFEKQGGYALNPAYAMSFGFLGGLIGGVFAVGGPFYVLYFLSRYPEKTSYNANLQVTFIASNMVSLALHASGNDFTATIALYACLGIAAVIVGSSLGMRWFHRLPRSLIERVALSIVFVAAMNLIAFA